jgi:hypothetical protein
MAATKPRIRPDISVADIDGEAVVYDPNGEHLHYLNHSAALVLDLCDGTATMKQMAQAIADVYEMPPDDVEKQVRTTVRELRRRVLLEPTKKKTPAEEPEPAEIAEDEREPIRMQVPRSA